MIISLHSIEKLNLFILNFYLFIFSQNMILSHTLVLKTH